MLNIANVDESLKMYIRKELLVDDFFELMSLVTENIYQGQSNQQVLQLDTATIRIKNGNLILLRKNGSAIMNFAEIRNFCKETVFETIFALGENCTRITDQTRDLMVSLQNLPLYMMRRKSPDRRQLWSRNLQWKNSLLS